MRKHLSVLVMSLLAALAIVPPATMADGYVGVGGGIADYTANGVDTTTAGRIHGGLMFFRDWGLEVGYIDFGEFDAENAAGGSSFETSGGYLALSGANTISSSVELTGKLGAFFFNQDVKSRGVTTRSSDGTSPFLGIGLRVYLSPSVALGAEVNHINDVEDEHINAVFVQVHVGLGAEPN